MNFETTQRVKEVKAKPATLTIEMHDEEDVRKILTVLNTCSADLCERGRGMTFPPKSEHVRGWGFIYELFDQVQKILDTMHAEEWEK